MTTRNAATNRVECFTMNFLLAADGSRDEFGTQHRQYWRLRIQATTFLRVASQMAPQVRLKMQRTRHISFLNS